MQRLLATALVGAAGCSILAFHCARTPEPETIATKWETALPGAVAWGSTPALGPDGTIYVIVTNYDTGCLCAVDPTGAIRWQTMVGASGASPSVSADGVVYVVSSAGDGSGLTAINSDGSVKWQRNDCAGGTLCPAIAADGTVYVVNAGGYLLALSPEGESLWSYNADAEGPTAAAIGPDGTVYLDRYGFLLALSPAGSLKWRAPNCYSSSYSPPVVGVDGEVCVTNGSPWHGPGAIFRFDSTGSERDSIPYPATPSQSPTIGFDRSICVTDIAATLYCSDSSGVQRWSRRGGDVYGNNDNCVALASDGLIYYSELSSDDRHLFTMFRGVSSEGDEVRKTELPDWCTSSPVIASDGTIYLLTRGDTLLALEGSAPPAGSGWPMFMHDARHTGCAATSQ